MSVYFTEDHEWIKVDGDTGTVGITLYAAGQLGDVVFVELPEIGTNFSKGDEAAVVESVKAASDVYAPISGEITGRNKILIEHEDEDTGEEVEGKPELVNESPESEAWFYMIKIDDLDELSNLMDEAKYKAYCEGL